MLRPAMSPPAHFQALRDVEAFVKLSEGERSRLAAQVVEALGAGWRVVEPTAAAVDVTDALPMRHEPTDLLFHLVPGGEFRMGLSDEDVAAFKLEIENTDATDRILQRFEKILRPVRSVTVDPFLVTPESIGYLDVRRLSNGRYWGDTFGRVGARDLAHTAGFRLPSEVEHEWLARDGRQWAFTLDCVACVRARREPRSRFGIQGLHYEQWMEDDWHPNYRSAPSNSAPWFDGDPRGVYRGGLLLSAVQSDSEYVFGLAALRFPGPRRAGPDDEPSEVGGGELDGIEEDTDPDALARFVCSLPSSLTG